MASNIGVQGSNPGRDCPVCEIFRMAKTDDSYVKIPTKTDQNDEKKRKGFDRFWHEGGVVRSNLHGLETRMNARWSGHERTMVWT